MGREALLDALVARSRQDGRLRHHARRREKRARPRERRASLGQPRGQIPPSPRSCTLGLMHTAQEFNDLIVSEENGRIIRFSDIGRAELGPQDMRSYMKMDGIPMARRRRDSAAGSQPYRHCRRRCSTSGFESDEQGFARRRRHALRIRQYEVHPRLDRRGEGDGLRRLFARDRRSFSCSCAIGALR